MDNDAFGIETISNGAVSGKRGKLSQIILTSTTKMILVQKQLKSVVKVNFEFHGTRNGTGVVTRGMPDFQSVKSHLDANNLSFTHSITKPRKPT
jgi:hypothetical protein